MLQLAPGKTEAVILKGPLRQGRIWFYLSEREAMPSRAVRYLGIMRDDKGNYKSRNADT